MHRALCTVHRYCTVYCSVVLCSSVLAETGSHGGRAALQAHATTGIWYDSPAGRVRSHAVVGKCRLTGSHVKPAAKSISLTLFEKDYITSNKNRAT